MIALLAALPALLLGCLVVRLALGAPRKLGWLMQLSLGACLGIGLTSCLFFVLRWAGMANRGAVLGCEIAALAGAVLLWKRINRDEQSVNALPGFRWTWVLRAAALLALLTFALDFWEGTKTNPDGEYDAVTIWNLRARYLAGGADTWHNAVSGQMAAGMTGASHPSYPMLTSSFIARSWVLAGETPSELPAAMSLLFSLATLGFLCSAVAFASGESCGLLAMLVLLATEVFVSQAASQYADIPLSFYVLATVALLAAAADRQWPVGLAVLAGLCAGLAAWTKNEGLPFALLACLVALWRGGVRTFTWAALGAAPGTLLSLALKFALATGGEKMFPNSPQQALTMIATPSRWLEISVSFARNFWELGVPWAHPLLLLAVLAFTLGVVPKEEMRSRMWVVVPVAGLLAADFGIYLISTTGLGWQLSTSNNRLLVQVWPALLFTFFLVLRPPVSPEEASPKSATEPERRPRKRRQTSRAAQSLS